LQGKELTPELSRRLAQEVVAKFRGDFGSAQHDRLTLAEVQGQLKSNAVGLELRWRTSRNGEPRGYEDVEVLGIAAELISQEQTLRLKERRSEEVTAPPIIFVSRDSKDWIPEGQTWPEKGYWPRYERWLLGRRPADTVEALDRDTNIILGRLGNPNDANQDNWDVRGLVVGQVQSGKTQNFIGVLAKAIDMGYRQIVVLSGIHEDLRAQTQYRVDEGLTGQTFFDAEDGGLEYQHRYVGVREEDSGNIALPDYDAWTSGSKKHGDISRGKAARVTGVTDCVHIAVVKKSTARLRRINGMYKTLPHLRAQPLIVIDDEADQASLNNKVKDDPTEINKQIRELLRQFPRSSYVGYTATPFANIFGDPEHETVDQGQDLFPRDFIVRLGQGPGYFGPAELFGRKPTLLADELGRIPAETMIQTTEDVTSWMPPKSGEWAACTPLPASLLQAIADFVVGAAIKSMRRDKFSQITAHTTMLINVPRAQTQQEQLVGALDEVVKAIKRDVGGDNIARDAWVARLRKSFEEQIVPNLMPRLDVDPPAWTDVLRQVGDLVQRKLKVALVNGTVKDMLEYDKHKDEGRFVIAVGGDKLSRGMTLEGLTVAYFLRRSNAWDTLLQMGRWFGYRPGYLDLCRLYTSDVILSRFNEVSQRIEELNQDLEEKFGQGAEPREIGIYVLKSELSLLPTRRTALRGAREVEIQGRHSGRPTFRRNLAMTNGDRNATLEAARWLFEQAQTQPQREPKNLLTHGNRHRYTFFGVPPETVAQYLRQSVLPPSEGQQTNDLLAENILKLAADGMVQEWAVSFPDNEARSDSSPVELAKNVRVNPSIRNSKDISGKHRRYDDISAPIDLWADITIEEVISIKLTPGQVNWEKDRPKAATARPESRGLLICYVVKTDDGPSATWYISFPQMLREKPYVVWANPVAVRAMYGSEDDK
jgi:hypothetical protein